MITFILYIVFGLVFGLVMMRIGYVWGRTDRKGRALRRAEKYDRNRLL